MQIFDPIHNTHDSYTALAVRTASPLEGRKELLHALQGLVCENLEILCLFNPIGPLSEEEKEVKLVAEMGDLAWFICLYHWWNTGHNLANAESSFEHSFNAIVTVHEPAFFAQSLVATTEEIASLIKKEFAYGKLISNFDLERLIFDASSLLVSLMEYLGVSLEQVCTANIAKLSKRYAQGTFSVQQAEHRDENAEEQAVADTASVVDKHSENASTFFAQSPLLSNGEN